MLTRAVLMPSLSQRLHKQAKPTFADIDDDDEHAAGAGAGADATPQRPKTAAGERESKRAKRNSQLRLLQADVKVNLGSVYTSLAGKYTTDANKAGHAGDQEKASGKPNTLLYRPYGLPLGFNTFFVTRTALPVCKSTTTCSS